MVQLLLTVLAIALLATATTAGISYVNHGAALSRFTAQMVTSGFIAWEQAYTAYRVANRASPTSSDDLVPFLPARSVKTPSGFSWSYGADSYGAFICLAGRSTSELDYDGLSRLGDPTSRSSSLPTGSISLGQVCGDNGGLLLGQPMAVTYRLTN